MARTARRGHHLDRRRPGRPTLALAAVAVLATALTSCGVPTGSSSTGSATGDVVLGLLAPLTGASAADGKLMQQGAQLAVDELNAAGGVQGRTVKLQVADVKGQTSDAVSSAVAGLSADPNIAAVVTGYASTTNFEIDQLAQAGIPYIIGGNSAQTDAIIAKNPSGYPGVWSVTPAFDAYSTDLPQRLDTWDKDGTFPLRNRKAYLISSDNPYSNGIADGLATNLKEKGWSVTGPDKVPFGDVSDWTTQITKLQQVDPAVVINTDYQTANAVRFLQQFRQNPTKSLVFEQYAPSVPEYLSLAKSDANGVLYNLLAGRVLSDKNELGTALFDKFNAKFSADPGTYGVALYEEVKLWAKAADQVGDPMNKAEVGKAIGLLSVDTSMGHLEFDQTTHLAKQGDDEIPLQFFQIQDGRSVLLSPAKFASGKFVRPDWTR